MMQQNYMALRQLLEEAAREFVATHKPPDHLGANGGAEVNRHLMNFLFSFRSFLDHSETHFAHADASGTWKQRFKECTSACYDTVFAYRLLYEFRNYVQHCGLPLGGIDVSTRRDPQSHSQPEFRVYLARDHLLQWRKWKPIVKTDLKQQSKEIPLMPLVDDLMECIHRLNKINLTWERENGLLDAAQKLRPALEEILTGRQDVEPALAIVPAHPTGSMDILLYPFPMAELREVFDLMAEGLWGAFTG
jgi:hypothetical protein